jgi:hypothetical protein
VTIIKILNRYHDDNKKLKIMKKTLLIIGLLISGVFASNAQDISENAIGIRFGDNDGFGGEISYQKKLKERTRLELDLGLRSTSGVDTFKLTGIHQWVWNLGGDGFNWFAGFGGGVGSFKFNDNTKTAFFAAGNIGIEYDFKIPLLVSLDYRPEIGFNDTYDGFNSDIALGLRYQF